MTQTDKVLNRSNFVTISDPFNRTGFEREWFTPYAAFLPPELDQLRRRPETPTLHGALTAIRLRLCFEVFDGCEILDQAGENAFLAWPLTDQRKIQVVIRLSDLTWRLLDNDFRSDFPGLAQYSFGLNRLQAWRLCRCFVRGAYLAQWKLVRELIEAPRDAKGNALDQSIALSWSRLIQTEAPL